MADPENVARGHKANLSNKYTPEESKAKSRRILEEMGELEPQEDDESMSSTQANPSTIRGEADPGLNRGSARSKGGTGESSNAQTGTLRGEKDPGINRGLARSIGGAGGESDSTRTVGEGDDGDGGDPSGHNGRIDGNVLRGHKAVLSNKWANEDAKERSRKVLEEAGAI